MASATSEKIKVSGRLSYPKIAEAVPFSEGDPPKFSAAIILDPSNPDHQAKIKEIKQAAGALIKEAYGPEATPKMLKGYCFGNGNDLAKVPDGYADMFYLRTSADADQRPAIANRGGRPVQQGDDQFPYAGAYVNLTFTLWAQNHPKGGKRINANLRGVQFVKDGEAFGQGPVSVDSEFEALEDNTPAAGDAAGAAGADDWDDDIAF